MNEIVLPGIISISIIYIITSYAVFIFTNRTDYRDLKAIICVIGLVIICISILMVYATTL